MHPSNMDAQKTVKFPVFESDICFVPCQRKMWIPELFIGYVWSPPPPSLGSCFNLIQTTTGSTSTTFSIVNSAHHIMTNSFDKLQLSVIDPDSFPPFALFRPHVRNRKLHCPMQRVSDWHQLFQTAIGERSEIERPIDRSWKALSWKLRDMRKKQYLCMRVWEIHCLLHMLLIYSESDRRLEESP